MTGRWQGPAREEAGNDTPQNPCGPKHSWGQLPFQLTDVTSVTAAKGAWRGSAVVREGELTGAVLKTLKELLYSTEETLKLRVILNFK